MSGWAALGEILSGGVKRQAEDEYAPQMARNGSAFKLIEEARRARGQNLMRDSLIGQMKAAGIPNAELLGTAMLTSDEVDVRRLGDWGNPNYLAGQQEIARNLGLGEVAMEGPMDNARRQRIVDVQAALSPDPIKRNTIIDSTAIDPYTIGDTGTPTAIGQMDLKRIGTQILGDIALATQRNASAGASNARAGASRASADKTRDQMQNPDKYRAPPKDRKAGKSASAPPPEAIRYLKANPQLKAQFDAKYGKGAADRVLGGD